MLTILGQNDKRSFNITKVAILCEYIQKYILVHNNPTRINCFMVVVTFESWVCTATKNVKHI